MRILLDTNIIIPLEDSSSALEASFGEFVRLAGENQHQLLAHPGSIEDINRDENSTRREISLSRFNKYSLLEDPPVLEDTFATEYQLTKSTENDRVDNEILFAIFKDAANILVSEDRKLHAKAARLGIKDRVFYLQQAVEFLRKLHQKVPVALPNIQELPLYQIDLDDSFFDSLREDYHDEFNGWFKKSAREGRRAWVYKAMSGQLGAICIFNIEKNPIVTNDNRSIPGKVLKLCTFKVGETVRGRRIGELFLKAAFRYATDNDLEHIYLHTRSGKQDFLIDFCKDFGFYLLGTYKADDVYVKDHPIHPPEEALDALSYLKKYYPNFRGGMGVGKYIVPIRPEYYKVLFPDNERQISLFQLEGNVVGNAIRQAYLCHARLGGISPGDILLFYRSHDWQAIASVGVVEQVGDYKNIDKIMQLVAKRTVYSLDEIKEMASKQTKVILFRIAQHLSEPITFDWLKKHRVVNGNIQTIRNISNESFNKIAKERSIAHCFYAD
ncbi:MAG: GNAT family N-acetyltransferase [Thermodesulfobacteriota bacterium]